MHQPSRDRPPAGRWLVDPWLVEPWLVDPACPCSHDALLAGGELPLQVGGSGTCELAIRRTRELVRVNEELAAANRHKDGFLASVSHELRTPLTVISGFAQTLERVPPAARSADLVVPMLSSAAWDLAGPDPERVHVEVEPGTAVWMDPRPGRRAQPVVVRSRRASASSRKFSRSTSRCSKDPRATVVPP